jgi:hypothetical protein
LAVQATKPWRYFVSLQALHPGDAAATAASDVLQGAGAVSADVVGADGQPAASIVPTHACIVPCSVRNCTSMSPRVLSSLGPPQLSAAVCNWLSLCRQVCRTDTARPSRTPVFNSRTFLLRLPTSTPAAHHGADAASRVRSARLAVNLFAAPSVEAPAGPIIAGRPGRTVARAVCP